LFKSPKWPIQKLKIVIFIIISEIGPWGRGFMGPKVGPPFLSEITITAIASQKLALEANWESKRNPLCRTETVTVFRIIYSMLLQ
jgi:hypothetical protein